MVAGGKLQARINGGLSSRFLRLMVAGAGCGREIAGGFWAMSSAVELR